MVFFLWHHPGAEGEKSRVVPAWSLRVNVCVSGISVSRSLIGRPEPNTLLERSFELQSA